MNWREQIEAQIANEEKACAELGIKNPHIVMSCAEVRNLLDVAVAAEDLLTRGGYMHGSDAHTNVADALDKLREVGDE